MINWLRIGREMVNESRYHDDRQPFVMPLPALPARDLRSVTGIFDALKPNPAWLERFFMTWAPGTFSSSDGGRINNDQWPASAHAALEGIYGHVLAAINALAVDTPYAPAPLRLHAVPDSYFAKIYGLFYRGGRSQFRPHYDGHSGDEYRAIFPISRSASAPRLVYYRDARTEVAIEPELGHGVLMNGHYTFHAVKKSAAAYAYRNVLVFTYTTRPGKTGDLCVCDTLNRSVYGQADARRPASAAVRSSG